MMDPLYLSEELKEILRTQNIELTISPKEPKRDMKEEEKEELHELIVLQLNIMTALNRELGKNLAKYYSE